MSIARNNPKFIRALAKTVGPPDRREEGLLDLVGVMLEKIVSFRVAKSDSQAVGFARKLLDSQYWTEAQLKRVPHYGALQPLSLGKFDRGQYAMLIIDELARLKRSHPGLGLSSESSVYLGQKKISNLELLQSWAILLNFGHLFGTFATERWILYALADDPRARREFLSAIETTVRPHCERILSGCDLQRAHAVIAAWRVSRWKGSTLRTAALASLASYLTMPSNDQLVWSYRRARQLAYTQLHVLGSPAAAVPFNSEAIRINSAVRGSVAIHEHTDEDSPLAAVLEAFDRFSHHAFLSSPAASSLVLLHLKECKTWWSRANGNVATRIESLFHRPADWPSATTSPLAHFVRVDLPREPGQWRSTVAELRADSAAWRAWNFLVCPIPWPSDGDALCVDIFAGGSLEVASLYSIATLLAKDGPVSWKTSSEKARRVWRGFARFILRVFSDLLKDGLQTSLEPVAATDGHYGYALFAGSSGEAVTRMRRFVDACKVDSRRRELTALADHLAGREFVGPVSVILGSLFVVDGELRREGELDGLVAMFRPDAVEWLLLEHKEGRGGSSAQLRTAASLMREGVESEPQRVPVTSGHASVLTLRQR